MAFLNHGLLALGAYLLGSIPTGFLVAKARGIDIRTVGSGNIGATNALRVLGKPAGIFVLAMDFLKGWVACALLPKLFFTAELLHTPGVRGKALLMIAALAAVLGHNYTCWLKFKGGKGIATSAGVLTALVPWALLIILSLFIIFTALTRYVSVGSLVASFTLPFATWFTEQHDLTLTIVTGLMGALVIYKHRANIRRLLNGAESRLSFKRKGDDAP